MIDALGLVAGSMIDDMARLAAISNNLANVASPGFKREIVIDRQFNDYLGINALPRTAGIGGEPLPSQIKIDHRPGSLRFTGHALDLAIEGDGFFELLTDAGPVYTRQGNFQIDSRGRVVSMSGEPVAGTGGEIALATSQPRVDSDGRIFDGEKLVSQLRIVHFRDPGSMVKVGAGIYQSIGPNDIEKVQGRVRQGHLENSNVVTVNEMVKIIETMRHFEANQKVIQGYDDMLERAIRTLGNF